MDLLHKDGVLGKVLNTVLPGVFLLSVTVRWRSPLLTVVHRPQGLEGADLSGKEAGIDFRKFLSGQVYNGSFHRFWCV